MTAGAGTSDTHPAAAALARAGWLALEHRLYLGLGHDVNGRLGSLHAVAHLLDSGEPLPTSFAHEVERLEGVARRLTLLAGDPDAPAIPLALDDLLGRALELHARLVDRDVQGDVPPGLPSLLVGEARMLRLLLLALDAASAEASADALAFEVTGDREGASLSFPAPRLDESRRAALDTAAGIDGGSVTKQDGALVLRLPSLSRARTEGR